MQKKVESFLHQYGMHYDRFDLREECDRFREEMERGLRGEESSLLMLPTYLPVQDKVPAGDEVVVMDAGGTNFRVGTVTFREDGEAIIDRFTSDYMPGTRGKLGREAFFDAIAERLAPVATLSEKVGFCFSFPTDMLPNHDGKLIHFNKEVLVEGVQGEAICAGINEALQRRGIPPKRFVLLNDTVATLLGGVAQTRRAAYESHIGYILGTGTNTCYVERSENIRKDPAAQVMGGSMIVNMESGGFDLAQGDIDRELDAASSDPGSQKMEKMISGAYQGHVIYRTVGKAMEDGLFSANFCRGAEQVKGFTMRQIDEFCFFPYGDNGLARLTEGNPTDTRTLYEIIDASFERAARLTAVNLGAILTHTGHGTDPTRPVCVTAEGTTFYKSKLFRGKLDYYVRDFLVEELGVYCEFVRAENATLVGTAVAGLLTE